VQVNGKTAYDSPIKSVKVSANGSSYSGHDITTGVLKSAGNLTVSATVTDQRDRTSNTATKSVTVLDYKNPLITALSVHRCNEDGTANDQGEKVKVVFSSSVTSLSGKNTATYKLEYKKTSSSTYTVVDLTDYAKNYAVSNAEYFFDADTGSSYNVRLTVTDDFDLGTKATTVSTGYTIMHWLASGLGMGIGKISELANVLDIGFKTRFTGGILHPVLEPKTDLNDVRTPNTYVGANISTNNYGNVPADMTSGTFSLEVVGMGEEGQVKQRLSYCHKTQSRVWERIYYSESWGDWVCVSDYNGQLLWSGEWYMSAAQTATLLRPIREQVHGVVLLFSEYTNGAPQSSAWHEFFVPKFATAAYPGAGHSFFMSTLTSTTHYACVKYLYISDTEIKGHDSNAKSNIVGSSGLTLNSNRFVLRYVIGV
jgi:hypothetical protein